jgi:hypothetical protein
MSKKKGRKRRVNHEMVVRYANAHPDMFQSAIAEHFHTTQSRVSHILREASVTRRIYRGRSPEQKSNQTDEQFYWEKVLHDAGLGMDAGLRLNNQRVLYGYDPQKETQRDESVTQYLSE